MRVVAIRHAAAPRVVVELVYPGVGASLESEEQKGLAHAIEHMIFKGTQSLPEGAINMLTQRYGAQTNAFTMLDATGYWFEVDNNNWRPLVSVLADCMENASFNDQAYASEVKTIIQELRQDRENPEIELLRAFVRQAAPAGHPYHLLPSGNVKNLEFFTSQMMQDFYAKYYRPEFSTLMLVGDLDPVRAIESVRSELERIPSKKTVLPDVCKEQRHAVVGEHRVLHEKHATPQLLVGWCVPGGGGRDYACAQVLSEILDSCVYGVLQKRLVDQDRCAENVSVSLLPARGLGFFYITCNPIKRKLDACVKAIVDELHRIATQGMDASALKSVVSRMRVDTNLLLEGITTSGEGLPLTWMSRYAASNDISVLLDPMLGFEEVTPEDLKAFVAKYFTVEAMHRIDLLPLTEHERGSWLAKEAAAREAEEKVLNAHKRTQPMVSPVVPATYASAQAPTICVPEATLRKTLENGLEIIVVRKPGVGLCSVHFGHRDGNYFDRSLDGMAVKVMSQMLLEGTVGMPKQDVLTWFNDRGVTYEFLRCNWMASCLPEHLLGTLDHLVTIIHQPLFEERALKATKKRLCNKTLRMKDQLEELKDRALAKALWPNTAYDWGFDDAARAIKAVTPESLRAVHAQMTNPAALVCVVAGDVDPEKVIAQIKHATQDWSIAPYVSQPKISSQDRAIDCDMKAESGQTLLTYVRRSSVGLTDQKNLALKVASQQLFKSFGSRLYALRESEGLFYDSDGEFAIEAGGGVSFDRIYAQVSTEKLAEAESRLKHFIDVDSAKPLSQDDLDGARLAYHGEFASSISGVDGLAEYFVNLARDGLDDEFCKTFFAGANRLTPETVSAVTRDYLAGGPFARVRVGGL